MGLISVLGLTFLLLISPCNIRNYFQANFKTYKTEANNKSKTKLTDLQCFSFNKDTDFINDVNTFSNYLTLNHKTYSTYYKSFNYQSNIYFFNDFQFSNLKIPLYILFQNIKIFL